MKLHSLRKDVKRGLLYTAGSLAEQLGQFEWNASRIMHAFTYLLSSQQQSRLATRHSLARLGSDSYHIGKAAKMTESWDVTSLGRCSCRHHSDRGGCGRTACSRQNGDVIDSDVSLEAISTHTFDDSLRNKEKNWSVNWTLIRMMERREKLNR